MRVAHIYRLLSQCLWSFSHFKKSPFRYCYFVFLALVGSTNTADAREQVEFLAKVYGDQAYGLMENSDLTPEERNGLYLMRARITQAEFKDRQDLAS